MSCEMTALPIINMLRDLSQKNHLKVEMNALIQALGNYGKD